FYLKALDEGRMSLEDVAQVLKQKSGYSGTSAETFITEMRQKTVHQPAQRQHLSVCDAAAEISGADWQSFMTDRISAWAASYFDRGQASWRAADAQSGLFASWKFEASVDRSTSVAGLKSFRKHIDDLPDAPAEAAGVALAALGIEEEYAEIYLHVLLLRLNGWASYVAYLDWEEGRRFSRESGELREFLCVLLCWEYGLLKSFTESGLQERWKQVQQNITRLSSSPQPDTEVSKRLILQEAFDRAAQRHIVQVLNRRPPEKAIPGQAQTNGNGKAPQAGVPDVQAVFCIDVRSEVYRRNLETIAPEIDTIGFAGFFGFPIRYVRLGHSHEHGKDLCPALIPAGPTVREQLPDAAANQQALEQRRINSSIAAAWKYFKSGAVASFGFVSPLGLSFLPKLLSDAFGWSRPVPNPHTKGLSRAQQKQAGIGLDVHQEGDLTYGIPFDVKVKMATGALQAMSLTRDFARLVLIAGHGSTTVNNPHATGLDCGACAGQSGEVNARVAAAILNDAQVRSELKKQGLPIPETTIFVAGLHDTTTDELHLYDEQVPGSHHKDLAQLKKRLAQAGAAARAERAMQMNISAASNGSKIDEAIRARSRDWAQTRPEWGLAGCSAFIVAPRDKTRGLDLKGRAFLHSYDWKKDEGFKILELIMTAPVVVGSWINLQYYGSTVDNEHLGSGNKTLHNVTAGIGVLEGFGGDLRAGLPMQSVHTGRDFQHEPLRLSVIINAPKEAMSNILERHAPARELCDNAWIFLMAMDEDGAISHRYKGNLQWETLADSGLAEPLRQEAAVQA
ncbi:MAG: YbcC family protein, partial [Cyclonatronaceae bacterium]